MLEAPQLGPLIRRQRQAHDLTLEELAKDSGVSRSMLSQVERGEANPTFATLWNLTRALGLTIDDLVAGDPGSESSAIEVMPRSATPKVQGDGVGATLWLLAPPEQVGRVEWYELLLEPGGRLTSSPHLAGTTEHFTVLRGGVTVKSGDAVTDVPCGGSARYRADVDHEISNSGTEDAQLILIVLGPSSS